VIVLHGSKVKGLTSLKPQYYGGNNGCVAGVGVNLTSSEPISLNYAGDTGSIYVIDLDLDNFINISDDGRLTDKQTKKIIDCFDDLNEADRYRLATDLSGKKMERFTDEKLAQRVFKKYSMQFSTLGLRLDRLKPGVEYDDDGCMVISSATKDFDLSHTSTERIHYCLNLYDNFYATNVLKEISDGLVIESDSGSVNYLSFRMQEDVIAELNSKSIEELVKIKKSHVSSKAKGIIYQYNT
jgi:hypothetical protein